MKFLITSRQGGKTAQMLEWMRQAPPGEHRICVSPTNEEAMRLLRDNRDLESWQFVSTEEIRQPGGWEGVLMGRGGHIVLGIDNVDLYLERTTHWPIGLVTGTGEEWKTIDPQVIEKLRLDK